MKKFLLKAFMLLCLILWGGVSSAWAEKTYTKVTNVSNLAANDVIILACDTKSTYAGEMGGNAYLSSVSAQSNAIEITLGKSGDNWTLTTSEGTIGATADKKMSKTAGTTTWTISITSGNATITNTTTSYGSIQYNASSPRFLNYTSSQTAIQIYKVTEGAGGGTTPEPEPEPDPTVQPTTVTFDNLGYATWGKSASFSGSTYDELTQTKDNVVFDYVRKEGSTYANNTAIRFYKSNELAFTAPTGYNLTSITFTGSSFKNDATTNVETCTSTTGALSWEGEASSVTFTRPSDATSYMTLSAVTVTLEAVGGSTPAPTATIDFYAAGEDAYYTTFSCDKAVTIPEMVEVGDEYAQFTVYTVWADGNELVLADQTASEGVYYLSENEGYLIKAEFTGDVAYTGEAAISVAYTELDYNLNSQDADNVLRPASEAKTGDNKYYMLAYSDSNCTPASLGFYWGAANGAAFESRANSAYLALPKTAQARGFSFSDGTEALESIEQNTVTTIYTLNGVKVNELQKGLNIVNGKKVMVRE